MLNHISGESDREVAIEALRQAIAFLETDTDTFRERAEGAEMPWPLHASETWIYQVAENASVTGVLTK